MRVVYNMWLSMTDTTKLKSILHIEFSRLKIGLILHEQTWEVHIKPFHPITDEHLPLIGDIIKNYGADDPVWHKERKENRMCIIRGLDIFLPENKFILIAFNQYSDKMGCITSIYPINDLPSADKGYKLV